VRRNIARRFEEPVRGRVVDVRLSGGISAYPEDGNGSAALIARADEAMYHSKSQGKDRISLYHAEQRQQIRYPVKPRVHVRLARTGDVEATPVVALNLSRGGVFLICGDSFETGIPVSLRFEGRDAGGRRCSWLHAGRVVRVEPAGWPADGRRIAVAFNEPLPDECLFQQVRRTRIVRLAQGARP
jgi:hypothetical protein